MSDIDDPAVLRPGLLPDINTSEAILYGDAYTWIKSALWAWDEMEDYLLRSVDDLLGQIIDREFAYEVMTRNRYAIFAKSPQFNDPDKIQDCLTLRDVVKRIAALRRIARFKEMNRAWARMVGIRNYVGSLKGRGITEGDWKAATADYAMSPIDFDSVHGMAPDTLPEEDVDWNVVMRCIMGDEMFDEFLDRMMDEGVGLEQEEDEGERPYEGGDGLEPLPEDDDIEDDADDGDEPEDDEDEDEDGPEDEDEPWPGFFKDMAVMFDDPVEALMAAQDEEEDDECAYAARAWESLDIDDLALVDWLIGVAA